MNKIIKNTIALTVITLVSGFLLGAVYDITKALLHFVFISLLIKHLFFFIE